MLNAVNQNPQPIAVDLTTVIGVFNLGTNLYQVHPMNDLGYPTTSISQIKHFFLTNIGGLLFARIWCL
jgi:hypothetical protein